MAASEIDTRPMPAAFASRLQQLRSDQESADFTIICEDSSWKVHSQVLYIHSEILGKSALGSFKEAKELKLDLSEHGADCVAQLVEYLYTFHYKESHSEGDEPLTLHTQLYVMADKYMMVHLKQVALAKLKAAAEMYHTTTSHLCFATDLDMAARVAWGAASATEDVRKVIVDLILTRRDFIPGAESTESAQQLNQTMLENTEMTIEVLKAALSMHPGEKRFQCPKCKRCFSTTMSALGYYYCGCGIYYTVMDWQKKYLVR